MKTRLELLKELKGTLTKEDIGFPIDLNEAVQESKLGAFNIDDNGVAIMNEDVADKFDEVGATHYWESYHSDEKEEDNEEYYKPLWYWLNIDFLNDWNNKYGYEETKLTKESLKEFYNLVDKEISKEEEK